MVSLRPMHAIRSRKVSDGRESLAPDAQRAMTCSEETSVREVAQIMVVNSTHYCVVINQNREVMGIISSRSILKAFGRDLDHTKARDIVVPYTFTITPLLRSRSDPIDG